MEITFAVAAVDLQRTAVVFDAAGRRKDLEAGNAMVAFGYGQSLT